MLKLHQQGVFFPYSHSTFYPIGISDTQALEVHQSVLRNVRNTMLNLASDKSDFFLQTVQDQTLSAFSLLPVSEPSKMIWILLLFNTKSSYAVAFSEVYPATAILT